MLGIDVLAEGGMVSRWWVLGPLPGNASIEKAQAADGAIDVRREARDGDRSWNWMEVAISDPLGRLDLEHLLGKACDSTAYLYVEVNCPEAQDVILRIGSDDYVVCWVNGKEVHRYERPRGLRVDQDSVPARLEAGSNHVLLRVKNLTEGWGAVFRVMDGEGNPVLIESMS
jgi:hypothetical protein